MASSTSQQQTDNRQLPPGWKKQYDERYQTWFYIDTRRSDKGQSQWTHPLDNPEYARDQPPSYDNVKGSNYPTPQQSQQQRYPQQETSYQQQQPQQNQYYPQPQVQPYPQQGYYGGQPGYGYGYPQPQYQQQLPPPQRRSGLSPGVGVGAGLLGGLLLGDLLF